MAKSITHLSSVTTIGLDLAKQVFQVHGIDAAGGVVVAKAVTRNKLLAFFASLPPCLVGMEACGSAHYWARELIRLGHDARMIPPAYVKPYVRRQKNDAADAAAICEAVTRPSMSFVSVRTVETVGRPIGSEAWIKQLEQQFGRPLAPLPRGPKPKLDVLAEERLFHEM
jgi:transposase